MWNADGEMLLRWAHDAKNKAEAIKRDSREARRTEYVFVYRLEAPYYADSTAR